MEISGTMTNITLFGVKRRQINERVDEFDNTVAVSLSLSQNWSADLSLRQNCLSGSSPAT